MAAKCESTALKSAKSNSDEKCETKDKKLGINSAQNSPVVLCKKKTFGAPQEGLGAILIRAFFKTLVDLKTKPGKIIFINEGVHLPCFDEQIIDYCNQLAAMGVEVLSCGTCLDYFKLLGQLKAGRVSNMYEIAGSLLEAGNVVEP